jgi:hypothetical protein
LVTTVVLTVGAPILSGARPDVREARSAFEARYAAWREHRRRVSWGSSISNWRGAIDSEQYRAMVRLGIPALPFMVEKVREDPLIASAIEDIAKFRPHIRSHRTQQGPLWTVDEFPDVRRPVGRPLDAGAIWLRWWHERRERTPEWFDQRYREWKRLKTEGKQEEAKQQYQLIVDLGLEALPLMVETMKKGSSDLVPALSKLTNGAVSEDAKPAECVQWWKQNKGDWTLPPPQPKEEPQAEPPKTGR